MATPTKRVRALNAMERQWVISKYATAQFWAELKQRFHKAKLWGKTIAAIAVLTFAWVKWGFDLWLEFSKFLETRGTG